MTIYVGAVEDDKKKKRKRQDILTCTSKVIGSRSINGRPWLSNGAAFASICSRSPFSLQSGSGSSQGEGSPRFFKGEKNKKKVERLSEVINVLLLVLKTVPPTLISKTSACVGSFRLSSCWSKLRPKYSASDASRLTSVSGLISVIPDLLVQDLIFKIQDSRCGYL